MSAEPVTTGIMLPRIAALKTRAFADGITLMPGNNLGYFGPEEGAVVENSLLFEGVTVVEGAHIHRCIVDKGVTVPAGERIGFDPATDAKRFTVSEGGIVVIPKCYSFSAGL